MQNKLIVIYGASGSGKSTLSIDIAKYYGEDNVVIISQDDYYHGTKKSSVKNFDEPSALDFELLQDNIEMLKNNKSIENPIYNFIKHTRENKVNIIEPKSIIILDGTMVMSSNKIDKISSYSIYCDIDLDICFIRRLRRDIEERGRSVDSVISQYINDVRPSFYKYIYMHREKASFLYNEQNKNELFKNLNQLI